jgi:hypothetical protein
LTQPAGRGHDPTRRAWSRPYPHGVVTTLPAWRGHDPTAGSSFLDCALVAVPIGTAPAAAAVAPACAAVAAVTAATLLPRLQYLSLLPLSVLPLPWLSLLLLLLLATTVICTILLARQPAEWHFVRNSAAQPRLKTNDSKIIKNSRFISSSFRRRHTTGTHRKWAKIRSKLHL